MKRALQQLSKQRAKYAKMDSDVSARLVDVKSHFDRPDAIGPKVKVRTAQELKDMKNHTELLQDLLCAINPDSEGDYGIVDYPFVLDVYTKMHETGFLARSQHKAIADFLDGFVRPAATKEDIENKRLAAIIGWHLIQAGEQPVFQENIDELFPEKFKSITDEPIDDDIRKALGRIIE